MKFMQEITDWDVPNHIYVLNDTKDKMYGYVRRGTDTVETVNKPYRFSTSGRKFQEVENRWGFEKPEALPEGFVKIVMGSKGERYTITEVNGVRSCTCPASKYQKGPCKHVQQIK